MIVRIKNPNKKEKYIYLANIIPTMIEKINPQKAEQIYYDTINEVEGINEEDYLEDAVDTLKRIVTYTIRNVLNSCGINYGLNDSYYRELYPIEGDVKELEEGLGRIAKLSNYKEGLRRKPKIRKTTNKIETGKQSLKKNISVIKEEILELLQKISEENPIKLAS